MEILSLNIGKPMIISRGAEQVETGIRKLPVGGALTVTDLGFSEDAVIDRNVHGGPDQALYLYSQEDYDWWSAQLGKTVEIGMFGENITTRGVDLSACKVGDQLVFDDVILEVTAPRVPCFKLAHRMEDPGFVKKFVQAKRPGAYVRVIKPGNLAAGDQGRLLPTENNFIATLSLFNAWHGLERTPEVKALALASPISEHQRRVVETWKDA